LYTYLRAGTKRLIEEYISEVVRALQLVCVVDSVGGGNAITQAKALAAVQQSDEDIDGDPQASVDGLLPPTATSSVPPETLPSTAEKLSFFNETRHAFGRSALLLSGGATLGLYHIGVMKALHDNNLLPRVLSGSSVGSIICAMVGTRTDEELKELFAPDGNKIKLNFFVRGTHSTHAVETAQGAALQNDANPQVACLLFLFCVASQWRQCSPKNHAFVHTGCAHGHQNPQKASHNFSPAVPGCATSIVAHSFCLCWVHDFHRCVKANVAPLTFQEAYELSGRIINIVVSPASGSGNKDSLRLLNYLTAPNVCLQPHAEKRRLTSRKTCSLVLFLSSWLLILLLFIRFSYGPPP
jgi:hypothetical protein